MKHASKNTANSKDFDNHHPARAKMLGGGYFAKFSFWVSKNLVLFAVLLLAANVVSAQDDAPIGEALSQQGQKPERKKLDRLDPNSRQLPSVVDQVSSVLLESLLKDRIDMFRTVCTEDLQMAIKPIMFRRLHLLLAGKMKQGYRRIYLGFLDVKTKQARSYLFKLVFDDEMTNDVMMEISIDDDLVAGFFILPTVDEEEITPPVSGDVQKQDEKSE